jgi:uncharacterized protein
MNFTRRMKWIAISAAVLLGLAGGCSMWRTFERSQVYFPSRTMHAHADQLGRPFEETWIPVDGERIHGWFFPAASDSPRRHLAFLVSHGNGGNISHRLGFASLLLQTGASVFLYDYQGYGKSSGRPGEEATYRDVQAAFRWLIEQGFEPAGVIAYGESLGGAVAAELAMREPVGGLILQSTFTSIPDVGAELFPFLPVRWLATIRYDTEQKLPRINAPVLILHSRKDRLIRFRHAEKNFAAANEPKLFREITGDHNEALLAPEKWQEAIEEFLVLLEDHTPTHETPRPL